MGRSEPESPGHRAGREELRRRAERLLDRGRSGLPGPEFDDVSRLVQELQVHQAELEIQNEELRRAREAEELSSRRHRDLFDFAPVGYFALDAHGAILEVNLAGAELLGVERRFLLRKPFSVFLLPAHHEAFLLHRRSVLASGRRETCELEFVRRGGEEFSARVDGCALTGEDGEARYFCAVVDVTEQRRAKEEMGRARAAAEAANRAKGEFLANMSHEIRTPMNGVLGMLALALESPLPPEPREQLTLARESAEGLLQIVDDILDFSRIEAGKLAITPRPFRLRRSLEDLIGAFRPAARERGLTLSLSVAPDVPDGVSGDSGRLRQVLTNLVGNALKFTLQGEVRLEVALAVEETPEAGRRRLRFAVADTGVGIPAEALGRLFASFTQVDGSAARRHGGTGLGLAISRGLVRLLGGELTVESEVGRGSTFAFAIPFEVSKEVGSAVSPPRQSVPPPERTTPLRVLVAEDNVVNRLLVQALLAKRGWHVTTASDGREAVTAWENGAFDVILMDVQMPEVDGLEATRAIRSAEAGSGGRTPVVALTAHAMQGDRELCLAAGMDGYATKPITAAALFAAVEEALAASSAASARAPGGAAPGSEKPPGA